MPVPLEDHVRQVLLENERGTRFFSAISDGWARAIAKYPDRDRWRRKSTFRAVVWEEVIDELAIAVSADAALKWLPHQDTVSIIAEDEVLFRLKHADMALTTSSYPTGEAQAFDDHDKNLYGYKNLQRVRLCYVPDQFETKVVWSGVAAHYLGVFLWNIELNKTGALAPLERLPLQEPALDIAKIASLKHRRGNASDSKDAG